MTKLLLHKTTQKDR